MNSLSVIKNVSATRNSHVAILYSALSDVRVQWKQVNEIIAASKNADDLAHGINELTRVATERHQLRRNAKALQTVTRNVNTSWWSPTVTTVGGVHQHPNTILDIYTSRQAKVWEESIKPNTDERHFGIEIELTTDSSKEEVIRNASELGLKGIMQIKRDGSIRTMLKREGFELCFCVAESQLEAVMAKAQVLLDRIGAVVNKSCGLHIHLDMRDTDRQGAWERYLNLAKAQNILKRVVTPDRLHNTYCRFTTSNNEYQARRASRYRAINFCSYSGKRTIEIRAFQSTTNTTEIYTLCKMLVKMMSTKNPLKRASNSLATLSRIYGHDVTTPMRQFERKYREQAQAVA